MWNGERGMIWYGARFARHSEGPRTTNPAPDTRSKFESYISPISMRHAVVYTTCWRLVDEGVLTELSSCSATEHAW